MALVETPATALEAGAVRASASPESVVVLQPSRGVARLDLLELWEYRELLYFLVWRDVKVRYKQTVLGAAWAVLQPFLTMVVFSVVFGRLAGIRSEGLPYPVFSFAALLPWQLFAHALTQSSASLVANQNLITKVYFPRLFIPLASVLGGLVDFGAAFVVLLALMGYYRVVPGPALVAVPLFVLFAVATGLAVGLWLSALNIQYRDVRYAMPFLTQFWLWATPVAYPSSLIPPPWRTLCGLNPMAGVVEGFRWALLGGAHPPTELVLVSALVVVAALLSGLVYFRRMEVTFADVV
jgi:homopolymeric O-antigen transport system permease protein